MARFCKVPSPFLLRETSYEFLWGDVHQVLGRFSDGIRGAVPGLTQGGPTGYALPIPWTGLSIIAEKIARECEYRTKDKKFVSRPYVVRTCVAKPDEVSPLFQSHRREIDFGPGCRVTRAVEDPNVAAAGVECGRAAFPQGGVHGPFRRRLGRFQAVHAAV